MKLVHLFGFIIKKFVTMYGHMNVKKNKFCLIFWKLLVDECEDNVSASLQEFKIGGPSIIV